MYTLRRDAIKEGNLGKMKHVIPWDDNEPIISFSSKESLLEFVCEILEKYNDL